MDKKELHDKLLGEMPEGAKHEATACPFCNVEYASDGGKMAEKLYDQEQLDSLVSAAVEKTVGEEKAGFDKELASVRAELTQASEDTEKANAELVSLREDIAEKDEAARLAILADERAASVKEATSFTDDELEQRKERWSQMSEDEFGLTLKDFETIAIAATGKKSSEKDEENKAPKSKFEQAREEASEDDEGGSAAFKLLGSMN